MDKVIYTVQHAESEHHLNRMVGSWTDWHLTKKGRIQADKIAENLTPYLIGDFKIISSDLSRAVETALPIVEKTGNEIIFDKRLREIFVGSEALGKSTDWLKNNAASLVDAESWDDFQARIDSFTDWLLSNEYDKLVIVAHGGTLSRFMSSLIGLDHSVCELSGKAAGVSKIELTDSRRRIRFLNDMSFSL